jgi:hypothetical protein
MSRPKRWVLLALLAAVAGVVILATLGMGNHGFEPLAVSVAIVVHGERGPLVVDTVMVLLFDSFLIHPVFGGTATNHALRSATSLERFLWTGAAARLPVRRSGETLRTLLTRT